MSNELAVQKPSFLSTVAVDADEKKAMGKFCIPPRLKIIQALTGEPYKPPFADYDAVIVPQMYKVGDRDTPFTFTPVYFFATYVCWNPANMRQQLTAIREISDDENSTVAIKARNFVREPCPENPAERLIYAQMLNFLCVIHGHEQVADLPIIFFFNRGEFKTGQSLIGLIQSLNSPARSRRFRAATALHSGKKGKWYGLDIQNDPEPWVTEEQFNKYSSLKDELKKLRSSGELQVDLNDSDVQSDGDDGGGKY